MRRETEAQIDILSEIVDDNEEATAYITGMEWMITTKWIRLYIVGEEPQRSIELILRGMGRSRNDSNELMSYGYITQIDILSEIQNRD